MESFTPLSGFLGGALIGLAATLLLLTNGRIAGISGILGGALPRLGHDRSEALGGALHWRLAFLVGLPLGTLLVAALGGGLAPITLHAGWPLLILAGLLVGIGTRLGQGCTSGHGVCGLARGSRRSLAATATFMAVAVATVAVTRHLLGL